MNQYCIYLPRIDHPEICFGIIPGGPCIPGGTHSQAGGDPAFPRGRGGDPVALSDSGEHVSGGGVALPPGGRRRGGVDHFSRQGFPPPFDFCLLPLLPLPLPCVPMASLSIPWWPL
jgi:hypothetical protein